MILIWTESDIPIANKMTHFASRVINYQSRVGTYTKENLFQFRHRSARERLKQYFFIWLVGLTTIWYEPRFRDHERISHLSDALAAMNGKLPCHGHLCFQNAQKLLHSWFTSSWIHQKTEKKNANRLSEDLWGRNNLN